MSGMLDQVPGLGQVAAAWPLGQWRTLQRLAAGRSNDSFHLVADGGEFVLRRLRRDKTPDALGFELALMHRLAACGVPVAEIMLNSAGAASAHIAGRLWTVSRFVASDVAPKGAALAQLGGEVLARFHAALDDFCPGFALPEEQRRLEMAAATLDQLEGVAAADALRQVMERSRRVLRGAGLELQLRRPALASVVIHGACRSSSLLVRDGRIAALLDMDSARQGTVAEDLGIALASFAKRRAGDAALDAASARAFWDAYRALRPVAAADAEALPVYLCQALIYPLVKALERTVRGLDHAAEFGRGAWRLAAAEHALARPADLLRCLCPAP